MNLADEEVPPLLDFATRIEQYACEMAARWLEDPMRYREACDSGPLMSASVPMWLAAGIRELAKERGK